MSEKATSPAEAQVQTLARRHRNTAVMLGVLVAAMLGAAYAAVPLYKLYCQVTGYGGTTQRVEKASEVVLDRQITIRFDANIGPGISWRFEPAQRIMKVRIGENALAFYRATNLSDKEVTGTATFNVTPDIAGSYFNKIACFCFTEQTLQPGQSVDMPVSFFVDPALVKDADAAVLSEITLSYTFYPTVKKVPDVAATTAAPPRKGS